MSAIDGRHDRSVRVLRGVSLVGVVAFLGVLAWYLGQPGYTQSRLALFVALGTCAIAGAGGVLFGRPAVTGAAVCVLVVLGVLQAVLWLYVLSVAALLLAAAVGTASERTARSTTG